MSIDMELDETDLWFLGYMAYNAKESVKNPYDSETWQFNTWNYGFISAKKDETGFVNMDVVDD